MLAIETPCVPATNLNIDMILKKQEGLLWRGIIQQVRGHLEPFVQPPTFMPFLRCLGCLGCRNAARRLERVVDQVQDFIRYGTRRYAAWSLSGAMASANEGLLILILRTRESAGWKVTRPAS